MLAFEPLMSDGGAYAIIAIIAAIYYGLTGLATALSIGSTVGLFSLVCSVWFSLSLVNRVPLERRHWLLYPLFSLVIILLCAGMFLGGGIAFLNTSVLETTQANQDAVTVPLLGLLSVGLTALGSVGLVLSDSYFGLKKLRSDFAQEPVEDPAPLVAPLSRKVSLWVLLLSAVLSLGTLAASAVQGLSLGPFTITFVIYSVLSLALLVYLLRRQPGELRSVQQPRLARGSVLASVVLWVLAQVFSLVGTPITLCAALFLPLMLSIDTWYWMLLGLFFDLGFLLLGLVLLRLGGLPGWFRRLAEAEG
jgi:hypothetical protein